MTGRFRNLEVPRADLAERERAEQLNAGRHTAQSMQPAHAGVEIRTGRHHMDEAIEEHRRRHWEPALRLYTRALGDDRRLTAAWVGQVQMLIELGEYHEARVWADKALEIFRNNGDLLAAKAVAHLRDEEFEPAMQASDRAVAAPGSDALRWISRGEVMLKREARRARDCFERAITEPAAIWFDRVAIAWVYLRHEAPAAAAEYARRAVEAQPGHVAPWLALAMSQRDMGMLAQARESYARCLEIEPGYDEARLGLIRASVGPAAGLMARIRGTLRRK